MDNKSFQSALLHEIQHWVQHKEGFPTGGNTENIQNQLAYRMEGADPAMLKGPATDLYQSLYGEAEARTVQRRFLDPEEAKLTPVLTRQKEAPDGDVSMNEMDALDRGEEGLRDALEYGDISYSELYPEVNFFDGSGKPLKRGSVGFYPSEKIARDPDTVYYKGKPLDEMSPKSTSLLGGDKPQRFYHGTGAAYKEFDPDAKYTFVSSEPRVANFFSQGTFEGAPNIRPVYLKDANFFDPKNSAHLESLTKSDWYKSNRSKLRKHPFDRTFLKGEGRGSLRDDYKMIEATGLDDALQEMGYDGFTTYEMGAKNLAVFNVDNIVPGVAKKKEGGIVSLLDVARNTGRGPRGVASLAPIARNMKPAYGKLGQRR